MSKPTVLYFGATRGVAFASYSSLAVQRPDLHHVLLIRSVSRFQASEEYKSVPEDVRSRSTYFEGDAHNNENVRDALRASGDNLVAIVSSIGYTPPKNLGGIAKGLIKGFTPNPPDICTRALTILVIELSGVYPSLSTKPKFILCSSMGMGKKAHKILPFGLGTMYTAMLKAPHEDKIAMEIVMQKVLLPVAPESQPQLPQFFPDFSEVLPRLLPTATYDALPAPYLPQTDVCIMRPALMTDGPAKGWGNYRIVQEGPGKEESAGKKLYNISRNDCGDFIAAMLSSKQEGADVWWGRQPILGY